MWLYVSVLSSLFICSMNLDYNFYHKFLELNFHGLFSHQEIHCMKFSIRRAVILWDQYLVSKRSFKFHHKRDKQNRQKISKISLHDPGKRRHWQRYRASRMNVKETKKILLFLRKKTRLFSFLFHELVCTSSQRDNNRRRGSSKIGILADKMENTHTLYKKIIS